MVASMLRFLMIQQYYNAALATVPDLPRCARCNSAGAGNVARVPPPHIYNAHNREGLESRLTQPISIKRPASV